MHGSLAKGEKLTSRLQTRTTDQKPVNIRLLSKILRVLIGYTPTVEDSSILSSLRRDLLFQPGSDCSVDLLRLLYVGLTSEGCIVKIDNTEKRIHTAVVATFPVPMAQTGS